MCHPGEWDLAETDILKKFINWDGTSRLYGISKTQKYGWICTSGVPVNDSRYKAFIFTDVTLGNVIDKLNNFVLQYFISTLIIIFVFCSLMTRYINKKVTNPVKAIADAAEEYVRDKYNGANKSRHFEELGIHSGDEIEELAGVMADMEAGLSEYEDNLTKITAEKERISTELDLANRIQSSMLPNIFPAFPERKEIDIYASMTPAKEVGGDFYDFFFVNEDHPGMVIADVSGKGIPAAMFMMMAKSMIRTNASSGYNPAKVLSSEDDMFGMERTLQAVNKAMDKTPKEIPEVVSCDVAEFVKDAEQFDDLTMLCIEYKGKNAS